METHRKKAKLFVQPKIFSKYYYALIDSVTLIMFYKQRPNKETSWHMSSFDSRCLTVAYFLLKI